MVTLEIHPRTGGADAEAFAHQLGEAIARHANTKSVQVGRTVVLERL